LKRVKELSHAGFCEKRGYGMVALNG